MSQEKTCMNTKSFVQIREPWFRGPLCIETHTQMRTHIMHMLDCCLRAILNRRHGHQAFIEPTAWNNVGFWMLVLAFMTVVQDLHG